MLLTASEALNISLIIGVYLLITVWLVQRYLTPTAKRVFFWLSLIGLLITIGYMLPKNPATFWAWFFDSSGEKGAGGIFSAAQLLTVALCAIMIGWYEQFPKPWMRLYWWFLAAFFIFMAADEYYSIHESIIGWQELYVMAGVGVVAATLAYFQFALRANRRVMILLVAGLAIMGLGGVGFERFANYGEIEIGDQLLVQLSCSDSWSFIRCPFFGFIEEFFEMAGMTLALAALLTYAEIQLAEPNWRFNRRVMTVGSGLATLWFLSSLWIIPSGEVALAAHPVQTDLGGKITITGYRVSAAELHPGDSLEVTIYARASQFLDQNYIMSVHLYTHPDIQSVAQADMQLGEWKYPTSAWVPGLSVRNTFELVLPDDAPANQSYWLTAEVWVDDWLTGGLPVVSSEHHIIGDDILVLDSLPILPKDAPPPPDVATKYHFNDGFSLAGYNLPDEVQVGQAINLGFWWQTNSHIKRDLIQFVHFFHENGTNYEVFDSQPFDGSFPTIDWPSAMNVMENWDVVLPTDMPPGVYQVQMGMYDAHSKERAVVTDSQGQNVQDYSVILGTITITTPSPNASLAN